MSTPLLPLQPPPSPQTLASQHKSESSYGPFIAAIVVITILTIIAVMIGRLCSGKRIMGYGQYDFEGWIERKCSSCIDGSIDPPPPPPSQQSNNNVAATHSVPVVIPINPPETEQSQSVGNPSSETSS